MQTERRPTTLLAELTHRCPLHCPYCSNPLDLVLSKAELGTDDWKRVISEARQLGVLQLGLSGGEPLLRRDLEEIVAHAHREGLYSTLVTSALGMTHERLDRLVDAGLEHVQISFQDSERDSAERIAGTRSWEAKHQAAAWVKARDVAFSVNVVLHRANLDRLEQIIDMAAALGADRVELANTQYYGWAVPNRDALMPTRAQVERSAEIADRKTAEYKGRMQIIYVLPCHAASQITSLTFDNVRDRSLEWIWENSSAFQAFRGDEWMREPCRSCARKHVDFGGCRCQAFALTGDARNTDPVCTLSPNRPMIDALLDRPDVPDDAYVYRKMPGAKDRVLEPAS